VNIYKPGLRFNWHRDGQNKIAVFKRDESTVVTSFGQQSKIRFRTFDENNPRRDYNFFQKYEIGELNVYSRSSYGFHWKTNKAFEHSVESAVARQIEDHKDEDFKFSIVLWGNDAEMKHAKQMQKRDRSNKETTEEPEGKKVKTETTT